MTSSEVLPLGSVAQQPGPLAPVGPRAPGYLVSMSGLGEQLELGRSAAQRGDWGMAYEVLSNLRREKGLDVEDLYRLGDAAWWLGLIRETLSICEECHERFLAEGNVGRAGGIAIELAFSWFLRGQPTIGSGWLSRGRALLDGQPLRLEHGLLLWIEAGERRAAGDVDGATRAAHELKRMATDLDEPVLGCLGLMLEGTLAIRAGDVERGFGLVDEAMLPVLAGRVEPAMAGNLYCQLISVCTDLADMARARRWTDATQRWCDTFSSAVMFTGICRVHRTQLLRLQGSWESALGEAAAAARELAELNVEAAAEAHYEIGQTHRMRGNLADAQAEYEIAAALGRVPEPGFSLLLLAAGRLDDAGSSIRRSLAEQDDPFRRARLLAAQAEIACARSDHETAEVATAELERIAERYASPGFRAWAATSRAAVLLRSADPGNAVTPLRAALAAYREMGASYDAAAARAMLGEALRATGDVASAEAETAAAQASFLAMGAAPPADWVVALSDPAAESPPGGLTTRETEVVRAVAEGLSNRDVAARLVISEKTVARHLANVFAKLGVSSRTAAAAWVHQQRRST